MCNVWQRVQYWFLSDPAQYINVNSLHLLMEKNIMLISISISHGVKIFMLDRVRFGCPRVDYFYVFIIIINTVELYLLLWKSAEC